MRMLTNMDILSSLPCLPSGTPPSAHLRSLSSETCFCPRSFPSCSCHLRGRGKLLAKRGVGLAETHKAAKRVPCHVAHAAVVNQRPAHQFSWRVKDPFETSLHVYCSLALLTLHPQPWCPDQDPSAPLLLRNKYLSLLSALLALSRLVPCFFCLIYCSFCLLDP